MEREIQKCIWDKAQVSRIRNGYSSNKRRLKKIFRTICKLSKNESHINVLNIGIGNGFLETLLNSKEKFNVYSLDPSQSALNELEEFLGMPKKNLLMGYADEIPVDDSFFHFVVASEVIEHIPEEEMARSLMEIKRVLKNGGYFIGTVPDNEDLNKNSFTCPYCSKKSHRVGHHHSFKVEDISNRLSEFFTIMRCYSFMGMNLNWKGLIYHHWVDLPFKIVRFIKPSIRAPHQIEFNIFFVAKKC